MAIKRLQSLIEMDKNSGAEIGRNIGVTKKVISDWKLGRSEPDAEQLRRLAEYFKVSVAYVLGETETKSGPTKIPIYEAEASAGHGCFNDVENVENYLVIDRETIRGELQCNPDSLAIIRVRGDSMTPTIKPGEMIIIDKTVNSFITDGIYVIRLDETMIVKRIQILLGKKVNVISANQAYPPFQIDLANSEGLGVVGRVMAIISMEKVGA